jgi:hypothetical protein
MKPQPTVDTKDLQQQIGLLQKNLAFVGQATNSESSDLFRIIHQPGWTTLQDVALARQIIETMNQQANALRGLRDTLETQVKASAARA